MPGVMGSISSAASPSIQQDATGAHESPLASSAKGRGRGQDKLSRSDRRHVFADGRGASDASATKILRDLLLALPASLEGSLCKPLQDRRLQICSARTHWPSVPDGPMRSARLVDAGQAPGTVSALLLPGRWAPASVRIPFPCGHGPPRRRSRARSGDGVAARWRASPSRARQLFMTCPATHLRPAHRRAPALQIGSLPALGPGESLAHAPIERSQ